MTVGRPEPRQYPRRAAEIIAAARVLLESEGREALTMRRLGQALGIQAPSLYKHLPGKHAVEVALIEIGMAEMGEALHRAVSDRPPPPRSERQPPSPAAGQRPQAGERPQAAERQPRPAPGPPPSAAERKPRPAPGPPPPPSERQPPQAGQPPPHAEGPPPPRAAGQPPPQAAGQPPPQAAGVVGRLLASYRAESLARPNLYRLATSGPLPRGELTPGLEDWAGEPWFLAAGDPFLAQAMWSFAHGMVILELDHRYPEGSDLDKTWQQGATAFALAARSAPPAPPAPSAAPALPARPAPPAASA